MSITKECLLEKLSKLEKEGSNYLAMFHQCNGAVTLLKVQLQELESDDGAKEETE